jgi:hypothetical protein
MKTCKDCGKQLNNFYAERCKSCARIYQYATRPETNPMFGKFGEEHPTFKGGEESRKVFCECGKELNKYAIYEGNKRCKSCARKEQYKNPENHPQWLGGLSRLPYTIEFNKQLKDLIRDRDNHKCQKCGKKEIQELKDLNKVLSIHHIDYNKCNCLPENLISLCSKCNTEVNADRDYWYSYFTELLTVGVINDNN